MALKDYDTTQLGDMFRWLDELRESGSTNMFGAGGGLMNRKHWTLTDYRRAAYRRAQDAAIAEGQSSTAIWKKLGRLADAFERRQDHALIRAALAREGITVKDGALI